VRSRARVCAGTRQRGDVATRLMKDAASRAAAAAAAADVRRTSCLNDWRAQAALTRLNDD